MSQGHFSGIISLQLDILFFAKTLNLINIPLIKLEKIVVALN